MSHPTVYVNGRRAGAWDYGYTSFSIDVTPHVRFGQANELAVHASHNPPAPEVPELCAEMGLLYFNEAFDKWDDTAGQINASSNDAIFDNDPF